MKLLLALALLFPAALPAQTKTPPDGGVTIWPKGVPDAKPNPPAEADTTTAKDNLIAGKPLIRLGLPVVGKLPIAVRFEVRDFLSGQPNYGVPTTSSLQNNVAFTGGLLLRF